MEDATPRRLARLLPVAIGFSVLGILGTVWLTGGFELDALRDMDWRFIPLALAAHVLAHALWGTRLAVIAQASGTPLRASTAWATITAGTFGGALTPGKIGGFGVNLTLLVKRGIPASRASRILMADRAADLMFYITMGIAASLLLPTLFGSEGIAARSLALAGTASLAIFMLFLAALMVAPRRTSRVTERATHWFAKRLKRQGPAIEHAVHDGLLHIRQGVLDVLGRRPALTGAVLFLTLANWVIEFTALWAVMLAFGHAVPFWMVFAVGVVLILVANIPITPGGAGVVEVAGLTLLAAVAGDISPLVVLAWRAITYDYDLLVGGIFATHLLSSRTILKVPEEDEALCASL